MKSRHLKSALLAVLLASAGVSAFARGAGDCGPMMGDGPRHERMGQMNPERMNAWIDRRMGALKAALKLTPAQEGAWNSFAAAMKPPADLADRLAQHKEIAKLPTPERIDKMKALRTQHMDQMTAAMDQRGEATKVFYATLTPEQQKTFDAQALRLHRGAGWRGGPHHERGAAPAKS